MAAPFAEAAASWTGESVASIALSQSKHQYQTAETITLAAQAPKKVGCYSLRGVMNTRERDFYDDDSALQALQPLHCQPNLARLAVNYDLSSGFDLAAVVARNLSTRITGRGENNTLIPLLKWILAHRDREFKDQVDKHGVKVVGQRSLVRQVGLSLQYPSRHERGWLKAACKFQDIVYIVHFDADDDLQGEYEYKGRHEQKRWAKRFKHLMVKGVGGGEEVNQVCDVVLRYDFNNGIGFLYDAKLDGYDSRFGNQTTVPENCYEVKLVRQPKSNTYRQQMKENKYGDWWQGVHFTGGRGIILGYRDDQGKFKSCQALEKDKLVAEGSFKTAPIVGCVDDFVKQLYEKVVLKDTSEAQYLLRWEPSWGGTIKVAEMKPDSEYRVLPQWFIDGMKDKEAVTVKE